MTTMTADDVQEANEIFCLYDMKGDGKIAASQIGDVLRSLNQNPTEGELKKCGYSQSPDSRIKFEVFVPILQTICRNKEKHCADDFIEGFRMFDKDQNGVISSAELRHILTVLGDKLTDDECDRLFANMEDGQGNINYEEFVKYVMCG